MHKQRVHVHTHTHKKKQKKTTISLISLYHCELYSDLVCYQNNITGYVVSPYQCDFKEENQHLEIILIFWHKMIVDKNKKVCV